MKYRIILIYIKRQSTKRVPIIWKFILVFVSRGNNSEDSGPTKVCMPKITITFEELWTNMYTSYFVSNGRDKNIDYKKNPSPHITIPFKVV